MTVSPSELSVEVVLDEVQGWQVEDGGKVQGLVEHALVGGPIAEEGHRYLIRAPLLGRESRASGDEGRCTHNTVGSQGPDPGVGDMHRASFALT